MSSAALRTRLHALAAQWPRDHLRPSLQFGDALRAATDRIFAPLSAATPELPRDDLVRVHAMVRSVERLLADAAANEYPLSDKTLKPASFPNHYTTLLEGVRKAERGELRKPGWRSWVRWK